MARARASSAMKIANASARCADGESLATTGGVMTSLPAAEAAPRRPLAGLRWREAGAAWRLLRTLRPRETAAHRPSPRPRRLGAAAAHRPLPRLRPGVAVVG